MTFGEAIEAMKRGQSVARSGWNGKGMWLALVPADEWRTTVPSVKIMGCARAPWIGMRTADNTFVPWLASQTDMLAEDWGIAS